MRAYTRRSSTKQRLAREPEGGFVIANQTILEPLDDDLESEQEKWGEVPIKEEQIDGSDREPNDENEMLTVEN